MPGLATRFSGPLGLTEIPLGMHGLFKYTFWVAWNAFPYKGLGYIQCIQEIISGLQNIVSVLPKYNGLYGMPGHINTYSRSLLSDK